MTIGCLHEFPCITNHWINGASTKAVIVFITEKIYLEKFSEIRATD